jgi:hypothetical protein
MADLVRFELFPGRNVLVEVDSVDEGLVLAGGSGRGDDGIVTAAARFSERLDVIRDAVTEALDTFKQGLKPDEITVTFGIKFTAEVGAVITKTALEGTLGMTMTWRRSTEP